MKCVRSGAEIKRILHYALRAEGFLLLGTSETVDATDLFQIEDKKRCIYRKRNVPVPEPRLPVFPMTQARARGELERDVQAGEPLAYGMLHLRVELRELLHAARKQGQARRSKPIDVRFHGDTGSVVLHMRPGQEPQQHGFVLIIFDEREPAEPTGKTAAALAKQASAPAQKTKKLTREGELEAELELSQQRLQAIIEEYETS